MQRAIQAPDTNCSAFLGLKCVATGLLRDVALKVKQLVDTGGDDEILIFDNETSRSIEVDFRGSPDDVAKRIEQETEQAAEPARGPGRPKLGVVAREVTLLPRHWDWLNGQPGGASVTLRRLVDETRKSKEGTDRKRVAQEAAYRFMSAMAGDQPGFEEASRALFAANRPRFEELVAAWPVDVRDHAARLAVPAFEAA